MLKNITRPKMFPSLIKRSTLFGNQGGKMFLRSIKPYEKP